MLRTGFVLVLAACSGGSSAPPANRSTAPVASLDRARAYERGDRVARDYRTAAEMYRTLCDDGHGDVAACGAWIRAGLHGRGADFDRASLQAFAARLCVERRDPFACVAGGMLSPSESALSPELKATIEDVIVKMPACDATHASSCWAKLLGGALDFSDSSSAEARRAELHHVVCTLGIVEGCVSLVESSSRRYAEQARDAGQRIAAACDAGDADACAAAPGRVRIPAKDLCAANDYEACAELGCFGDDRATKLAASHGVEARDCDRVRGMADAVPVETLLAQLVELRDGMCACKDKACATQVQDQLSVWAIQQEKNRKRPTPDQSAALQAAGQQLDACLSKLTNP